MNGPGSPQQGTLPDATPPGRWREWGVVLAPMLCRGSGAGSSGAHDGWGIGVHLQLGHIWRSGALQNTSLPSEPRRREGRGMHKAGGGVGRAGGVPCPGLRRPRRGLQGARSFLGMANHPPPGWDPRDDDACASAHSIEDGCRWTYLALARQFRASTARVRASVADIVHKVYMHRIYTCSWTPRQP